MFSNLSNQGELADAMEQASKQKGPSFTQEELRALFSLNTDTSCETAVIMQGSASAQEWQVRPNRCPVEPPKSVLLDLWCTTLNQQESMRMQQQYRPCSVEPMAMSVAARGSNNAVSLYAGCRGRSGGCATEGMCRWWPCQLCAQDC